MANSRRVYSSEDGRIRSPVPARSPAPTGPPAPNDGVVRIFRDRSGRNGKVVTVIRGLPVREVEVRAAERRRVGDVLAQVGMTAYAAARVGALSVGQQQRVLIARALVSDPELLILDEPTGGVDPEAQTNFYALLHHLNREREVTLILVSHDIGVVAKEVTRLACLNRRLIFHGRPGDFLSDAALAALYGPAVRVVSHEH